MEEPQEKLLKQTDLKQFTGTEKYHKLSILSTVLFTDGCAYVAQTGNAFWLMNDIALFLTDHPGWESIGFVEISFTLVSASRHAAKLCFEDGDENQLLTQDYTYTNFPLVSIKFFAQFDGEKWVVTLPSEY